MGFLSAIGAKALGYIVAVVAIFGVLLAAFKKGEKTGETTIINGVNEETNEAHERMLKASIDTSKDRENVAKAADSGRF